MTMTGPAPIVLDRLASELLPAVCCDCREPNRSSTLGCRSKVAPISAAISVDAALRDGRASVVGIA